LFREDDAGRHGNEAAEAENQAKNQEDWVRLVCFFGAFRAVGVGVAFVIVIIINIIFTSSRGSFFHRCERRFFLLWRGRLVALVVEQRNRQRAAATGAFDAPAREFVAQAQVLFAMVTGQWNHEAPTAKSGIRPVIVARAVPQVKDSQSLVMPQFA
jgi:hypothetical protein